MTTKEAQIILLKSILETTQMSEPDKANLQLLIDELEANIVEHFEIPPKPEPPPIRLLKDGELRKLPKSQLKENNQAYIPKYIQGMNFSWNLNLISGPKLYIECGKCGTGFKHRMPLKSYPNVMCSCGAVNKIPLEYR